MKAELKAAVLATGSHLMDIHGIGPAGAARILADVGDVTRFPDRGHFASWNGTAPIDASSGQHTRHRLSRAGNRRINACSTWPASSSSATTPLAAPATGASSSSPRPPWKRCAACGGAFPAPSTASSSPTPPPARPHYSRRAREGTPGRLYHPARPSPGTAATPPPPHTALKTPAARSCHITTARHRCQRGAPHWTNDVDTDQRRRTLDSSGTAHLTNPVIEGSHDRTFVLTQYIAARVTSVMNSMPDTGREFPAHQRPVCADSSGMRLPDGSAMICAL